MFECSGGTAVTCGVRYIDAVAIGFIFGVWNVKMDILQFIRRSASHDFGRSWNMCFQVKRGIIYEFSQPTVAPESYASDREDSDVKCIGVVQVAM